MSDWCKYATTSFSWISNPTKTTWSKQHIFILSKNERPTCHPQLTTHSKQDLTVSHAYFRCEPSADKTAFLWVNQLTRAWRCQLHEYACVRHTAHVLGTCRKLQRMHCECEAVCSVNGMVWYWVDRWLHIPMDFCWTLFLYILALH